ncbi:hypothetical protein O181_083114 [Austropuccinia psidii MF-1]|uniref:Uncharacterized protein n=1 Tax=Austropuccinia psidii MF-1 TaxID=1389203 RepID=A0A9Q3ILK6_9BASI|nr:hypothetical protein [Austropuccinia psidii MF-1]
MPRSKTRQIKTDMKIRSGLPHPSGHLICTDYLTIINWLSIKSNFKSCFGTSGSTSIGRPPSSNKHGFQLMAIEVNKKSQNCLSLSSNKIQDQWQTYKKKYMAAKKFKHLTGAGLMEEDESKGIKSMSEKLESMCLAMLKWMPSLATNPMSLLLQAMIHKKNTAYMVMMMIFGLIR